MKTTAPFYLALVLLFSVPVSVVAQDRGDRSSVFDDLIGRDLNPLSSLSRVSAAGAAVPLEGAIDPQTYYVGPGDLFTISVGGAAPVMVTIPVSADGFLMLPDAGAVDVAGLTLEETRRQATQRLREQFQRVRLEVTLSQPRQFYVHVSGAVPTPGRFIATPIARLATVVYMAFADTMRSPVGNVSYRPAMRNVKLIRKDGSQRSVDLLRYFSTGNTEHNPYLQDGDVISIPTYDPNYDAVFVSGAVAFPGTYDFRADDNLFDLLVLTTGQNPPAGFTKARITRTNDDGSVGSEIYDVGSLSGDVKVRPRDQVYALSAETVRGTASVSGWVNYPGTYSIVPGRTSLGELIQLAGGLRQGALPSSAYLERATLPMPRLERIEANRFEVGRANFRVVREDTAAILKTMRLANMDFLSRAYLAQELRLQSRVPIDLEAVLQGGDASIMLRDGDKVVVPRDENSVFVFGQVNRPGHVTVAPGRDASYYIGASGGTSEMAGQAYVIEAGTGRYVDASNADLQSGDLLFVDRRDDRADDVNLQRLLYEEERLKSERRSRVLQIALQAVSATTSVVMAYLFYANQN